LPVLLAFVYFVYGLPRLAEPYAMVFDEIYYVPSALQYVWGVTPLDFAHPPGSKLLMAIAIALSGVESSEMGVMPTHMLFARAMSLALGSLGIAFACGLGREVSGRWLGGLLAAGLLMLDTCYYVHSRLALTNIYGTTFILLGVWGAARHLRTGRFADLLLCGLGFGLAVSCRWTSLAGWAAVLAALVFASLLGMSRTRPSPQAALQLAAALVLLPGAIYLASHLPLILQPGNDWDWQRVVALQATMWHGQGTVAYAPHPYLAPWYSWPLLWRPMPYYYAEWFRPELLPRLATAEAAALIQDPGSWRVRSVWAIGNPFVWWASLPALTYALISGLRRRVAPLVLVALAGLGLWLVWGVSSRTYTFTHYYLEVVPYGCVAAAAAIVRIRERRPSLGSPLSTVYLTLAVGWASLVYPLTTAEPVSMARRVVLLWFGSLWR
jgi:dolichyl-phosphate-mannose--protein O-mannosyl transferase